MISRRGNPDVIEAIPVEAQESTCMRGGGELKCRAIYLCGSGWSIGRVSTSKKDCHMVKTSLGFLEFLEQRSSIFVSLGYEILRVAVVK